jgi:hypothetical protein
MRDVQTSGIIFALTVDEFCAAYKISRSFFYDLVKTGKGPVLMHVGKRTLVSIEASAAWRIQMESAQGLG